MRTLVIPDVHQKHRVARRIIESAQVDDVVLLGDYFDDFYDDRDAAFATAEWLRSLPFRRLMGNHDLAYRWADTKQVECPGFTLSKNHSINAVMHGHWEHLLTHTWVDDWLLSHAGFHMQLLPINAMELPTKETIEPYLKAQSASFVDACRRHKSHTWQQRTKLRGGIHNIGGPFWQDWRQTHVTPVNQLMGHTANPDPRFDARKFGDKLFYAHCIDTDLNHYGIITDGDLKIHRTPIIYFQP